MNPGHISPWPKAHLAWAEANEGVFVRAVYRWMCGGLLLTAGAAYWTVSSPLMHQTILETPGVLVFLFVAELLLVFALSARATRLAPATAAGLFLVYSLFNGFTLSGIVYAYAQATITGAFAAAAVMFGVMSIAGMTTRRELTSLGVLLFMALIGIVVATVANFFLRSDAVTFAISVVGVVVFAGLTAWDTQKLKEMAASSGPEATQLAIVGALALYLDFLNLFLFLLQILGGRRRR